MKEHGLSFITTIHIPLKNRIDAFRYSLEKSNLGYKKKIEVENFRSPSCICMSTHTHIYIHTGCPRFEQSNWCVVTF